MNIWTLTFSGRNTCDWLIELTLFEVAVWRRIVLKFKMLARCGQIPRSKHLEVM